MSSKQKFKIFAISNSNLDLILFSIRKDEQDYDKALLLELLTQKLLNQKQCVLALKIRKDEDNSVSMIDNLNEIIPFSNPTKVLELLLALQDLKNPDSQKQQISNYGRNLLQEAIKDEKNQFIKPDPREYNQSDTFYIDRDKSQNFHYSSYNNQSFENNNFKEQLAVASTFKEQMVKKNRFNEAILSNEYNGGYSNLNVPKDQDSDKPSFLFGAFQRIQQKQGDDNPFGIKFEIPPLPQCPNFNNKEDQSPIKEAPNFFSFIKNDDYNQDNIFSNIKVSKGDGIKWPSRNSKRKTIHISEQKTTPPYNRRVIKQKYKKYLNKRSLIWNLMPHINETQMPNNMKESSGIQRLWEDENIDFIMRQLKVGESGLITQQKMKEFNKEFRICTEDQLSIYERKIFTEYEVVSMCLLMLQGVPSQLFLLKNEKLTFFLRPNYEIKDYSLNSESNYKLFESLLDCGSFFLHLREFTEFMSLSQNNGGMILQNFVLAISDFLTFYYNQINQVWVEVEKRRSYEDQNLFNLKKSASETNFNSRMTFLELYSHTNQLQNQIKIIATICFTQKFIEDLDLQDDKMVIDEDKKDKITKLAEQIYTQKNLREKYQLDIENIKTKVWLENFPKGASLLSYLYRILLCCESDLQAVDLLRRLFQKASQPLLSMINSFIFTGDFEDPYQEFFIEKLYRRGVNSNLVQIQDYLFKVTSKPLEKVPIFLLDSVSTIFKAGSSLHLLRKQGNQLQSYQDSQSVRQYYEICSSGINHQSDVKFKQISNDRNGGFNFNIQSFNQMHLDFQIEQLRQNQELKSKHFENQTELLQQIEMAIIKFEEETYYKQLVLREEAKREYVNKREQEIEKERQMKIDKQQAYMKQVQQQIDELQKRKEEEKLVKIRENEAIRKEQQEYEMRKKAIEEDLKRQLREALREDQKLGEVSKNEGNSGEEELERKLQIMIEEKKQDESNNQMMAVQLINNQRVNSQNANQSAQNQQINAYRDVQMENDEQIFEQDNLKLDEKAILGQNQETIESDNPLLSIINDALLKAKINLDQSVIQKDIQEQQNQNQPGANIEEMQDPLSLEEIKILTDSDQIVKQSPQDSLSQQELTNYIIAGFIKPLFEKLNKRIDDIEIIRKKRYTWNKIRKDEQIQKYQDQKSKWRYQEPSIPVRNKLNGIFQEFQKTSQPESKQTSDNQQNNPNNQASKGTTYSVPVSLALQQCVLNVIKDQFKLVNKCLIHLMFRRLRLFRHLESLKQFYFCNQGDIISLFMSSLFNNDFQSSVKENTLSFINEQFDIAIRLSHPEKFQNQENSSQNTQLDGLGNFNVLALGENFDFQAVDPLGINSNENFYFTAFNVIFLLLQQLIQMQDYVKLVYKRKYPLDMRLPFREYNKIRQIQLLRNRMHHFTSMLEQYALTEVIQASWQTFKNNLPNQTIFEDLIKLHNEFLDQVMMKCFIDKKDHKIMGQITKLFTFVLQFNKLVKQYGADIVSVKEAIDEVRGIQDAFERYTYYLYQLVKHLASKGSFKELFLRLDFNKFYDKGNINSQVN